MIDRKELSKKRNEEFLSILSQLKKQHGIANKTAITKIGIKQNRLSAMKIGRTSATLEELELLKKTFSEFLSNEHNQKDKYITREEFETYNKKMLVIEKRVNTLGDDVRLLLTNQINNMKEDNKNTEADKKMAEKLLKRFDELQAEILELRKEKNALDD